MAVSLKKRSRSHKRSRRGLTKTKRGGFRTTHPHTTKPHTNKPHPTGTRTYKSSRSRRRSSNKK